MNKVELIGRLVKSPELKTLQSGTEVTNFTIAVDNPFKKDDNGNYTADFIPIVVFGKAAEFASKYFTKGLRVGITGRIQTRTWQDTEEKKHYATEVVADSVEFADGKTNSAKPNNSDANDNFVPVEGESKLPF